MKHQALAEDLTLDAIAFEPTDTPDAANQPMSRPAPPRPSGRSGPSLSLLLRGLGGLVIVAAFVTYLFQGWREGDDLTRSLLLLGHTAILTLAGFASGNLLREAKGARLFIALALAAVPVNFAFLGGLTYDQLTWDAPLALDTAASFWHAGGGGLAAGSVLLVTAASVAGLALAVWIGFLTMARRSALPLTGLYLLANATLLVPTRDGDTISAILLVLGLALAGLSLPLRRRDPALATPEGVFARAVLLVPLLILGGRSVWLYAPDALFFMTLSLIGYLGLRQAIVASTADGRWRGLLESGAVLLAGIGTGFAFGGLMETAGIAEVAKIPLSVAVFAGLLVDLSTISPRRRDDYRNATAIIATLAILLNLAAFGGFWNALACLALGIATLVHGYAAKSRVIFAMGVIAALAGFGFAAQGALETFTIGGWSALVLLGVATIIAGSVVERHGARIKAGLSDWYRHFDADDRED